MDTRNLDDLFIDNPDEDVIVNGRRDLLIEALIDLDQALRHLDLHVTDELRRLDKTINDGLRRLNETLQRGN